MLISFLLSRINYFILYELWGIFLLRFDAAISECIDVLVLILISQMDRLLLFLIFVSFTYHADWRYTRNLIGALFLVQFGLAIEEHQAELLVLIFISNFVVE